MSRQAEAERERRSRIITADGEFQASQKLASAATVMADTPAALQLRLLQTIVEVAAEKNSTLVLPFPVELLRFLDQAASGLAERSSGSDLGDVKRWRTRAGRPCSNGCCDHKRIPVAPARESRTAEDSTDGARLTAALPRALTRAAVGPCPRSNASSTRPPAKSLPPRPHPAPRG
jgi:hypothetical protein